MEVAVDQDVAGCTSWSFEKLPGDAKFCTEGAQPGSARETLRAEFEEKAVASDGMDDAPRAFGSFHKQNFNARFLECIGGDQPGDATTNHQSWYVTGHGEVRILVGDQSVL